MYHPLTELKLYKRQPVTTRITIAIKRVYQVKESKVSSKASSMPVIATQKIPALAVQMVVKENTEK
jgi:hypothetical protein